MATHFDISIICIIFPLDWKTSVILLLQFLISMYCRPYIWINILHVEYTEFVSEMITPPTRVNQHIATSFCSFIHKLPFYQSFLSQKRIFVAGFTCKYQLSTRIHGLELFAQLVVTDLLRTQNQSFISFDINYIAMSRLVGNTCSFFNWLKLRLAQFV